MPRDISGVFSLPVGNPVVTGTVIESIWANTTMTDVAAQLNNVFTRDGTLGATSPFRLVDGSAAAPALSFNSETSTGFYRIPTGQIGVSIQGTKVGTWSSAGLAANISGSPLLLKSGGTTVEFDGATATLRPISDQTVRLGDSTHRWSQMHTVRLNIYSTSTSDVMFSSAGSANININSGPSINMPMVTGQKNSKNRWSIALGNSSTESSTSTGSDFSISRYDNNGNYISPDVFTINRSVGEATISTNESQKALSLVDMGTQGACLKLQGAGGAKTVRARVDNSLAVTNSGFTNDILILENTGRLSTPYGYGCKNGISGATSSDVFNVWWDGVNLWIVINDLKLKLQIPALRAEDESP